MKKKLYLLVPVVLVVAIVAVLVLLFSLNTGYPLYITPTDITVENYVPSVSNIRTTNYDDARMTYCNGKLYIHYLQSPPWNNLDPWDEIVARIFYDYEDYGHALLCVDNGSIRTIGDDSPIMALFGSYDEYIYYCARIHDENGYQDTLCAYNTQTEIVTEIVDIPNCARWDYDFTSEGVLQIADGPTVHHIKDGKLLGDFPAELACNTIQLGENKYFIDPYDGLMYCNDKEITEKFPIDSFFGLFHPVGDGAVYEDSGNKGFLCWYIDSSGEIISLLPEMEYDYLRGCLCVYEDYIFVSFHRKRYGLLDAEVPYENDDISGVYRIDTRDLSSLKISDQYCDSMQIFDDTGIYVTQYEGVYKMDFDGNLLLTIIER